MAQWLPALFALTEHPCLAAPNRLFNFNTGGLNASVLHMHMHSHAQPMSKHMCRVRNNQNSSL